MPLKGAITAILFLQKLRGCILKPPHDKSESNLSFLLESANVSRDFRADGRSRCSFAGKGESKDSEGQKRRRGEGEKRRGKAERQ
jgi:hypothetical protein